METAAYEYLHIALGKLEALALYYRMTAFLRERDPAGFSAFMAFRESTRKDRALMDFVLRLMAERHPAVLAQLVPAKGRKPLPSSGSCLALCYAGPCPLPRVGARQP